MSHLLSVLDTTETKYYAFQALIRAAASIFRRECTRVVTVSIYAADRANQRVFEMIEERFKPSATTPYCDYATAYRKLRSAWRKSCQLGVKAEIKDDAERKPDGTTCWHRQNKPLLELVQKRAYDEFHAKIMLTIGARMPVELTRVIFDLASEAEEIAKHDMFAETKVIQFFHPDQLIDESREIRTATVMLEVWRYCACERYCVAGKQ